MFKKFQSHVYCQPGRIGVNAQNPAAMVHLTGTGQFCSLQNMEDNVLEIEQNKNIAILKIV